MKTKQKIARWMKSTTATTPKIEIMNNLEWHISMASVGSANVSHVTPAKMLSSSTFIPNFTHLIPANPQWRLNILLRLLLTISIYFISSLEKKARCTLCPAHSHDDHVVGVLHFLFSCFFFSYWRERFTEFWVEFYSLTIYQFFSEF